MALVLAYHRVANLSTDPRGLAVSPKHFASQLNVISRRYSPVSLRTMAEAIQALFNGATIRYEPLSIVRHQHRRQWHDLARQAYGYAFGHVVALFAQYARDGDPGDLARVFLTLPRYYARRLLLAPRGRLLGEADRLLWSEIRGYLSGVSRFRLFVDAFRRKR